MRKFFSKIKDKLSKIGTLNYILLIVLIAFVLFNYEMILLYKECGSMPETYAIAVIAALIGECGMCGKIFTSKLKLKEKELEYEFKKSHPDYKKYIEFSNEDDDSDSTDSTSTYSTDTSSDDVG